jgi:hypothetical protein
LDLLSFIEEGHHREDGGSVSKPKGWRERKNLECSLNFDVGGIGSSRGKGVKTGRVCGFRISFVGGLGSCFVGFFFFFW